jgi:hypothetical protein
MPLGTNFYGSAALRRLPRNAPAENRTDLVPAIRHSARTQMFALYLGSAIFSTSAMVGPSRQKARWARHSKTSI